MTDRIILADMAFFGRHGVSELHVSLLDAKDAAGQPHGDVVGGDRQ